LAQTEWILSCEKLTVDFDGFVAVNQMDFQLARGELRFLIGPNGAGKTTMLDMICGKTKPTSGKVFYGDATDISRKKEHQIAAMGIARKFQAPSIFQPLSVFENMELALKQNRSIWTALFRPITSEQRNRIMEGLQLVGLHEKAHMRAGSLSHGEKQWLEIGMMLLQEPTVLLLDEPVAGMTDVETEKTGELLMTITTSCSVVVVEHDMEFVRAFSSTVTVMHEGMLLKEGSMDDIQNDQRVAEVYLGQKAG